jgi:hypothetical protein
MTLLTLPNSVSARFHWNDAAPWVTWASTDPDGAARARAVGIHTMRYADPNLLCSIDSGCIGDPHSPYIGDESAFEHCNGGTDAPHRAATSYDGKTLQWMGNVASPTLVTALQRYIDAMSLNAQGSTHPYDAILLDDVILPHDRWVAKTWQSQGFSPGGGGTPCASFPWDGYAGDAAQLASWRLFHRQAPLPVVIEGLGAMGNGPYNANPSDTTPLINDSDIARSDAALGNVTGNTLGGMYEGAWGGMNAQRPKETPPFWQKASNDQITITGYRKLFFAYTYPDAGNTDVRGYVYASFLLTYDPQFSVYGTYAPGGIASGFSVGQETTLVPLDPLQTAAHDIEELHVASGAYRREFLHCYIAGLPVGACAVVVNPDPSRSVPFPALSNVYSSSFVMSGAGLLPQLGDNGQMLTTGAAPPSQLPPSGWSIVFASVQTRFLQKRLLRQ